MENLNKKEICEICKKEIIGKYIYFEDGWIIHSENENSKCIKEAERRDAEVSPDK